MVLRCTKGKCATSRKFSIAARELDRRIVQAAPHQSPPLLGVVGCDERLGRDACQPGARMPGGPFGRVPYLE